MIDLVGRGRVGAVYLAHDTLLDRDVAIKFILSLEDAAVARFLVEARAAARVQHPNVATLYRVGELAGRPYLVSEFVHGVGLDEIATPLEPDRLLQVATDLARGLAAAHRRGVLHRDIKPGNAILSDAGEAKLLDFGLAKLLRAPPGERPSAPAAAEPETGLSEEDERQLDALTAGHPAGTPYFMAPEIWRLEEASQRSDIYSLGVLLYELSAGRGPFRDVPPAQLPRAVQESDPQPLRALAPAVPEGLGAVIDRCVRRDAAERFPSADEIVARLEGLRRSRSSAPVPKGNPYRGLRPFEVEHRALFFGRHRSLAAATERLRREPFLLVTGDSGVGKSSLCTAGLIPYIVEGGLGDALRWAVARFVPGRGPLLAAAAALAPVLGMDEAALEQLLREQPDSLGRTARKRIGPGGGVLVYADQLEELVTLAPAGEAEPLSEALGALAAGIPCVRLLATARSDFLSRLKALPGLSDRVSGSLFLLAPLGRDEVREAIVGPASVVNVRFESEQMVDKLVDSTVAADGGMPLLQFALAELWERRDQAAAVIRERDLASLGGVSGALSRHADRLLDTLRPAERETARTLLLRLVTVERTRAHRRADELGSLSAHAPAVLERLVRGRLLVAREVPDGTEYEIAHEALVEGWETLAGWLAEESESRVLVHRVEGAAAEWLRHGRPRELLWSGPQLAEVSGLSPDALTSDEGRFLDVSRRAQNRRRWLRRGAVMAIFVLAAAAWGGARLDARHERNREVATALQRGARLLRRARAIAARLERGRKEAFAAYDAGRTADGAQEWAQALRLRNLALGRYRDASDPFERALLLDPARADVRRRYANLLYERAVLAEREHDVGERDELVQRMLLYDDSGKLAARWHAPARLTVTSNPSGAEVMLYRYRREGKRLVARKVGRLGRTPITDAEAAPGSLLLLLRHPGRAPVRYPIAVGRAERVSVDIPLLAPQQIPRGFIWIPPGRFLFGCGQPQAVCTFFHAVPQHERRTGGFFIARYETTFGDWIKYLDALPPAERRRRTPTLTEGALRGAMKMTRLGPGRWKLMYQPGTVRLEAVMGQKIHYPGRKRHADQDWLKLPVSGIAFDDALAYARWLDRSGRVPGARLCSEEEWERAARGADDRLFPCGDALRPDDADIDQTYGQRPEAFGPDEVGSHPGGRSPFGVDDMAGNVWEWVIPDSGVDHPMARGGGYYWAATTERIANREQPGHGFRDIGVGMRVCASAPPHLSP